MELFFLVASIVAVATAILSVVLRKRDTPGEPKHPSTAAIRVQQNKAVSATPVVSHQFNR